MIDVLGLREHKASDHIKDEVEAVDPLALDTGKTIIHIIQIQSF